MKHSIVIALVLGIALTRLDTPARAAGAPGTMAFSARILDGTEPFTGELGLRLALYRTPDQTVPSEPIWSEDYTAKASDGVVAVVMGELSPLGSAMLDGGKLYLEVTITRAGTPTTLEPRLSVGSVPYALMADFARDTAAVPPGAVMHFDLDACPSGWSELTSARGRTIVGGTRGEPVGAALSDREDRAHTHRVDPVPVDTSPVGAHTHGSPRTGTASVDHTHGIGSMQFNTENTEHNHQWSNYGGGNWSSFDFGGTGVALNDDTRLFRTGSDGAPLVSQHNRALYTAKNIHRHVVNLPASATHGASSTGHDHSIALPGDGAHLHSCDVGDTVSRPATTSQVMPYLQLLVCRKN